MSLSVSHSVLVETLQFYFRLHSPCMHSSCVGSEISGWDSLVSKEYKKGLKRRGVAKCGAQNWESLHFKPAAVLLTFDGQL